jgi:hypothetical protein
VAARQSAREVVTHLRHRQQSIAVMHSQNIIAHGVPRNGLQAFPSKTAARTNDDTGETEH